MVWTWLQKCYGFDMRLFIGGQAQIVPARWYFCLPGAKQFPFPHGCESSVWLDNYEVNEAWGEVTPYPRDKQSNSSLRLDRGDNPGYPGQCYVGEDQWFRDGDLPADIGPCPDLPPCCKNVPFISHGGIVLAGAAVVHNPTPAMSKGYLVLSGQAVASARGVGLGRGSFVLAGKAVPIGPATALAAGQLVLAGASTPSAGLVATAAGQLVLAGTAAGLPVFPGPTCTSAAPLGVSQTSGNISGSTGGGFYKIILQAGLEYSLTTQFVGPGASNGAVLYRGTCDGLNDLARVFGSGCNSFVAPYNGWYYIQVSAVPTDAYFSVVVNQGPC